MFGWKDKLPATPTGSFREFSLTTSSRTPTLTENQKEKIAFQIASHSSRPTSTVLARPKQLGRGSIFQMLITAAK